MIRKRIIFVLVLVISPLICVSVLVISLEICKPWGSNDECPASSCGNNHNIHYPFRLQTDPIHCGDYRYEFSCENNFTVWNLSRGRFYVQSINYDNFTIRLVDPDVHADDCSSLPHFKYQWSISEELKWKKIRRYLDPYLQMIMFINCQNPVKSPRYVETAPCVNFSESALKKNHQYYSYVYIGDMKATDLMELCSVEMYSLFPFWAKKNMSFIDIHRELAFGFQLSWHNINSGKRPSHYCYVESKDRLECIYWRWNVFEEIGWLLLQFLFLLGLLLVARDVCGAPCVVAFLIYKWRRRHLSGYEIIEEFLQSHNNLMPIRYSYSDIRKITKGFKEKLGEGGFGFVYKGKLRSGQLAAIKMLSKSKANGQDFINEVATIGRIHHTNVVHLIGFSAEGSKRALVYEFMSNGSLDNYIFHQERSISLSWEKLYEISLGVARGIEYLHRGCEVQILHFDIKPHNILLDENFTPKISDFGLAKLYPVKGSITSLTAARGTIGYMAPELFYKNIGRVSYKADVYSFGMLLLEMTGKRKNLNALVENLSQVYYPFWIYDQLSSGKLIIEDSSEEENKLARKMIITGLWCIQMQPCNRPPMNKVLNMLEGDLESLELPPRPILYPEESMTMDGGESSSMSSEVKEMTSTLNESI